MSLTALLFRGLRYTVQGVARVGDPACSNCRKGVKRGSPILRVVKTSSEKFRVLHMTCAEAIAADGNEHTREIIE